MRLPEDKPHTSGFATVNCMRKTHVMRLYMKKIHVQFSIAHGFLKEIFSFTWPTCYLSATLIVTKFLTVTAGITIVPVLLNLAIFIPIK